MQIDHTTLDEITTLDALEALLASDAWEAYLQDLDDREDADGIDALRASLGRARSRLSPEHASPALQRLKAQVYSDPDADPDRLRDLLQRIAALRAALPTRAHARLFSRLETQIGQRFAWTSGGVGYSNRARRARHLFTEFAGQTHIAGADTDRHGNAAGTGYDLGRDGAFEGHSVHVLQLYNFGFGRPRKALERKGFAVHHRTKPGSPADFRDWLADAEQLWLISTSARLLKPAHITAIHDLWKRGGSLYIWGDNDPFYADANAVIDALFDKTLRMSGDLPGAKIVNEIDGGRGFLPHLVTTGLVHLFEGITVASLKPKALDAHGFSPLLYGSAGNLITIVREATATEGAVIIDGAFTRLYCQWDDAGTARYVCNAGCFLGAMTGGVAAEAPPEDPADEPIDEPAFVADGAFQGTCDLTGVDSTSWMVLSVSRMGDALANTSDRVLNDPLCAGAQNCVFSESIYSAEMGQWLLNLEPDSRVDPFTRAPVVACLPLVDLSYAKNRRGFTQILCACLMDGKYLPSAAQQVFVAVVDEMLARPELTHRDAWEYLRDQCLANFRSTPGFDALGEKIPLIDAMAALFSPATDEKAQLRRSFESVGVIGRTLLDAERVAPATVRRIARRARVAALIRDALAAEKNAPGSVPYALNRLLYENFYGIPRLQGGRLIDERPPFARDVSTTEARLATALEQEAAVPQPHSRQVLLDDVERTAVLHALLPYDLRQFSAEALTARMYDDAPAFAAVWDDAPAPDVIAALNERFAAYVDAVDWSDPHYAIAPPFATTSGPSVFRCVCGEVFGDPRAPLTEDALEALRAARTAHFRDVYRVRAKGETWYPGDGTLHYNLHRAVQRVMAEQFTDATRPDEAMVPAVAGYLLRDGKGFIYDPLLEQSVRTVLESYLMLRRLGQPHPTGVLTLETKARLEQQLSRHRAAG